MTRFWCVGSSMYACVRVFCDTNATILLVYIPTKIKMRFIWKDTFFDKIAIFCKPIAGPLSESKKLTLTRESIGLCMVPYQGLYAKFVSLMTPKCSIVEHDGELMLMALHTHFLPMFLAFHTLVYRWRKQRKQEIVWNFNETKQIENLRRWVPVICFQTIWPKFHNHWTKLNTVFYITRYCTQISIWKFTKFVYSWSKILTFLKRWKSMHANRLYNIDT